MQRVQCQAKHSEVTFITIFTIQINAPFHTSLSPSSIISLKRKHFCIVTWILLFSQILRTKNQQNCVCYCFNQASFHFPSSLSICLSSLRLALVELNLKLDLFPSYVPVVMQKLFLKLRAYYYELLPLVLWSDYDKENLLLLGSTVHF